MNAVILEGDSSLTGSDAAEPASQAKGVASVAQVCCTISMQYKHIVRCLK